MDGSVTKASPVGLLVRAFLLNILNPKQTIFFLAFLPQFVPPASADPLAHLLVLSGAFMLMTFVVFVVCVFLAHGLRRLVIESAVAGGVVYRK
jgi:threonine/homoserine/homoserine lactone efflux protein